MANTTGRFAPPPTPGGDRFDKSEHEGRLLAVDVFEAVHGFQTRHGEAEGVRARVVVIDGDEPGSAFDDALVFGWLGEALQSNVGQTVLGRLVRGEARSGNSAPWILEAPTETDAAVAEAWFVENPDEPAGGVGSTSKPAPAIDDDDPF
jgi:hypothetical protein